MLEWFDDIGDRVGTKALKHRELLASYFQLFAPQQVSSSAASVNIHFASAITSYLGFQAMISHVCASDNVREECFFPTPGILISMNVEEEPLE